MISYFIVNSIPVSRHDERGQEETYRVVKFMVKVRLIENNVNSHVGSVMVVKVMSQYSARGMT